MPLEFKCSSSGEEVESFRASWVRFVETEMLRHDAEARRRGHVGHELWRRAGELGFRCVDIPEEWGGDSGGRSSSLQRLTCALAGTAALISADHQADVGTPQGELKRTIHDAGSCAKVAE
jgi:acyl-CoA dehydrogenase